MKEKGLMFCQGRYDYLCRQNIEKPHYHKVYEDDAGKSIIEWEVMYDANGIRTNG